MILVDFSKIAHWESAGGKVNFQVIAVLNWHKNLLKREICKDVLW